MLFGAHCSGGVKKALDNASRDGRRGRAALRPEPAHLAVPRARPRRPRGIQIEARSGGHPRPRPRPLPRQPRRAGRRDLLEERRHDARDHGCGLRDRGRRGDLPRRLASRRRLRDRPRARRAGDATGARPLQRANVAADGELGRRRRDDRPLDRRARRDLRRTRTARAPRRLPRLVPSLRLGRRRHRSRALDECARRGLDARIGLDRLRALHANDCESAARIESRPPRQHRRGADRRRARGLPRATEAAGPARRARGAGCRRQRPERRRDPQAS